MTEANESDPHKAEVQPAQSKGMAADQHSDIIEQTRLGILQAVERKEISVEEALRLLHEMEIED